MSTDCFLELLRSPLKKGAIRTLEELGVPMDHVCAMNGAVTIGSAGVTLSAGGERFEPEGPDARLLLAVEEYGEVVDLVALASHDPDRWALRLGVGWCLGHDHWVAAQQAALAGRMHSLRLFGRPIDWLRARGEGMCIVDFDAAAIGHLRQLGERVTLRCDPGARSTLEKRLMWGGLPRVAEEVPECAELTLAERLGRKVAWWLRQRTTDCFCWSSGSSG